MTHEYLLEIGLEEMPAHVVTPSIKQLIKRAGDYLKQQRITFDSIKPFSTPRRLTIQILGLSDKQPDINKSVKGPSKKIAQDDKGNWTKAAIGFTRGQGLTPDDIQFKNVKGTDYVFVNKHIPGKPVQDVLSGMKKVITDMTFPTMMKWNVYHLEYVRPIRWIVSILDDQVIPFSILDVKANRITRGHRFLGHDVAIKKVSDYEDDLKQQYVIADAKKRKQLIVNQIHDLAKKHHWQIKVDPNLLEEVNNLVEWPTIFAGSFNRRYLELPASVLITSMRDNQRFFYVEDQNGKLLPYFVSARNGNSDYIENVIAGNEKVLTARLDDAMFFYHNDMNKSIDYFVNRLKRVSFHDRISTMYEKMQRVEHISQIIGKHVGLDSTQLKNLKRASQIYKFDLVTEMVGEFAELQGVIGAKYAQLKGENDEVARAIREQYMPISSDGELPQSKVGATLALADKFDSILTFFSAGMIPSGSNDPYALRRQAIGIVRIIRRESWHLNLNDLLNSFIKAETADEFDVQLDQKSQINNVIDFIKDRIVKLLQSEKIHHDIIESVVNGHNPDILFILDSADVLNQHQNDSDFKLSIESLTRVMRISNKANFKPDELNVDPNLFQNDSEKKLNQAVDEVKNGYYHLMPNEIYQRLSNLKRPISDYFEQTMIMDKNSEIKNNHLKQMVILTNLILWFADLDKLIVK
ncbi:glycine--tRNA ligase beta subunit [Philodulcilactobacillus myokoensis]|uniref:Glycine--tRNA ligase beta subunit n=1 Tax=Philodulcilactobacillus myokoensis TaxID=2929573 RepID=A0A9W6B1N8_9LACO|nr:glycine--tRNA ligase subunit beta [Philodulcilactobacillus myokoensis]GLB46906.1 glycine--tRNA ligase beta subunit [Philodulcilactobacillus myokoensis]